ncbi:MFS transporter [Agrococcus sp. HG114]|uniref:MFS transporter n=1 Tax=Agrococcus sp. HG114 TaxID=2969757 RepID=UPI00215B506A|nr:MFS transporter [Agrococcus sp. HG114]MCR8671376.1 MFS transporter [Agrococcus sp. HG114]
MQETGPIDLDAVLHASAPAAGVRKRAVGLRQLTASVPIRTAASGTQIAIPILTLQVTGDLALGALLAALALVPAIVAAPLVGAILDHAHRPRAWLMSAAAGCAAAYGITAALGPVPVWLVAIALVISGLLTPFGFGGLSSFVAPPGADARRAYALDALSYNVGGVAGPAIVAALVPTLGARAALVAMAVIALASLVAFPLMPMQPRETERKGLWRSMAAGIVALTTRRSLAVVTTSGTLVEFGRGIMPIAAIPIAIAATGDPAVSAVIVAAFAIGALVGAALEPARGHWFSPPATMAIGFAATSLATMAAALHFGLGWTIALIAVSGLCTAAPTAAMLMLRRTQSPDAVVAQVFTVGSALRTAAAAAGTAVAGLLAGVDPMLLLAGSGAVWLLGAAVMALYPRGR